jgi:predicted transcriptional regulator of viral defense system
MSIGRTLAELADLAESQQGMLTTRQADDRGIPRRDLSRLAGSGGMERVAHGVYRLTGAPRPRLLELRAAWLQLAPGVDLEQRIPSDGVVSHASAATVFDVGLLEPVRHEFTFPSTRRVRSRRDDVRIHHADLGPEHVMWFSDILVTTPVRLIDDLCAAAMDGSHLAGVVADLVHAGHVQPDGLVPVLGRYAGRYGSSPGDGRALLDYLLALGSGEAL